MRKQAVLFLCTGNSARSQMAEAILKAEAGDRFDVYSAGMEPRPEIHPLTIEVMREVGLDLGGQYPKSISDFLGKVAIHHPIAVCAAAEGQCPRVWPFGGTMIGLRGHSDGPSNSPNRLGGVGGVAPKAARCGTPSAITLFMKKNGESRN